MVMLILETFLLMLLAAVLGTALGSLLAEAYGGDEPTDRPWLRDLRPVPALPALPRPPVLLAPEERARLAASLAESAAKATAASVSAEAPAPAPQVSEPEPVAAVSAPSAPEPEPEAPSATSTAPELAPADAARAAEADGLGARPAGLLAPRDGHADDLKRIKGIGRQNESRLNALGVWHFDQIAAWTPENIRWAGSFLAFQGRIEREDWVGQAKVLAAGGATAFSTRVDAGEVPTSSPRDANV